MVMIGSQVKHGVSVPDYLGYLLLGFLPEVASVPSSYVPVAVVAVVASAAALIAAAAVVAASAAA